MDTAKNPKGLEAPPAIAGGARKHAKLAPSAAHRWFNCPGSVALAAKYPETSSDAADEGTWGHELAAQMLKKNTNADVALGAGSSCGRFECDDAFAAALQVYLDAVRLWPMLHGKGTMYVEQHVALRGFRSDVHGTADALWISVDGTRLDVFDLKLGKGVFVDVTDNEQALCYALGAAVSLGQDRQKLRTIGIHIVQPRFHGGGRVWRTMELDTAALLGFGLRVVKHAEATEKPDAPLAAGDWCTFCPAKAECPALRARAHELAAHVFADPPAPVPAVAGLSPAVVAELLPKLDLVESWISEVRAHAYKLVEAGVPLPGFKLVAKEGNRAWIDETAAETLLRARGAKTHVDPKPPAFVSPAQAEAALAATGMKKAAAKALVAPLAAKAQTGTVLVPESDPRPAFDRAQHFQIEEKNDG